MIYNEAKHKDTNVRDISVGFDEDALPRVNALLVDTSFELYYESGKKAEIGLFSSELLKWEKEDRDRGEQAISAYTAIKLRKDMYFIDFVVSGGDSRSVSIVLDVRRKFATVVTGVLPRAEQVQNPIISGAEKAMPLTPVKVIFEHASIDRPFASRTRRHREIKDFNGERIQWVYGTTDAHERVNLSENRYTWHCISGNEKGLSDADQCFCYKLWYKLYLFVWIEKTIPRLGIMLKDLKNMRSYGKIFGHDECGGDGRIVNFSIEPYGVILSGAVSDLSRLYR